MTWLKYEMYRLLLSRPCRFTGSCVGINTLCSLDIYQLYRGIETLSRPFNFPVLSVNLLCELLSVLPINCDFLWDSGINKTQVLQFHNFSANLLTKFILNWLRNNQWLNELLLAALKHLTQPHRNDILDQWHGTTVWRRARADGKEAETGGQSDKVAEWEKRWGEEIPRAASSTQQQINWQACAKLTVELQTQGF